MSCPFHELIKATAPVPAEAPQPVGAAMRCPFHEIVKATVPAVAPRAREIVDDFYPRMFANNPETKAFFNPANQFEEPNRQRMALTNAVLAYASNIDQVDKLADAVAIITHKHAGLGVQAEHYPIVHKNLLASIAHVMGDAVTPEIGEGWSEAVLALAKILIGEEKKLYGMAEARSGGWAGVKDFKVSAKRALTQDCAELTFVPAEGPAVSIDFTPGQFLTVHVKKAGATPRHYTVTSAPGCPYLQCCPKKIGFVSGALHDLEEGDVVGLSPPFGVFALTEKPAVLISAGIGVTPMKAFLQACPEKVALAVHVDKAPETHPFRQEFLDSGVKTHFHYTSRDGRPAAAELVEHMKGHLGDCAFFLCGPSGFVSSVSDALRQGGVEDVYIDAFGPTMSGQ